MAVCSMSINPLLELGHALYQFKGHKNRTTSCKQNYALGSLHISKLSKEPKIKFIRKG